MSCHTPRLLGSLFFIIIIINKTSFIIVQQSRLLVYVFPVSYVSKLVALLFKHGSLWFCFQQNLWIQYSIKPCYWDCFIKARSFNDSQVSLNCVGCWIFRSSTWWSSWTGLLAGTRRIGNRGTPSTLHTHFLEVKAWAGIHNIKVQFYS